MLVTPAPVHSYSRRRKPVEPVEDVQPADSSIFAPIDAHLLASTHLDTIDDTFAVDEPMHSRQRSNKRKNPSTVSNGAALASAIAADFDDDDDDDDGMKINDDMENKPSVKLVISKKKGSIFKSRAIDVNSGN